MIEYILLCNILGKTRLVYITQDYAKIIYIGPLEISKDDIYECGVLVIYNHFKSKLATPPEFL